jgi:preprotein translocase subunit SecE
VKEYSAIIIVALAVGAIFVFLWRSGQLARLATYIQETREELKKCTWPTWDELKGSTVVVMISIVLLGGFTVAVDYVILLVVSWMVKI